MDRGNGLRECVWLLEGAIPRATMSCAHASTDKDLGIAENHFVSQVSGPPSEYSAILSTNLAGPEGLEIKPILRLDPHKTHVGSLHGCAAGLRFEVVVVVRLEKPVR